MKKNLIPFIVVVVLNLFFTNSSAQTMPTEQIGVNYIYHYCNIESSSFYYFGANEELYKDLANEIKNIKKMRINMNRITEEMNIMSRYGWEFVQVYTSYYSNSEQPREIRIYRKKINIDKISSVSD